MLVSFATTGEKTVAAVMSPKNKTVSLLANYGVYIFVCLVSDVDFDEQNKFVTLKLRNIS